MEIEKKTMITNTEELSAFLKSIDLFSSLQDNDLKEIIQASKLLTLDKEGVVFEYGSTGRSIFVIVSGEVIIFRNRRIISKLSAGNYFGELALLSTDLRSASVKAADKVTLLEIPAQKCRELLQANIPTLWEIIKTLSSRLRQTNSNIVSEYESVNMIVHDMRNVLSALSFATVISKNLPEADPNKKILGYITDAKNTLAAMIERVLGIAKGEPRMQAKEQSCIDKIIQECIEKDISMHEDVQKVSVEFQAVPPIKPFTFNPLDMKRVVANLVINAAQASDPGAVVKVALSQTEDNTTIEVTDQGCGIPEESKSRIFDMHFTSKKNGNGIGLGSCKEIVEKAHRGSLTFESRTGKGTTFRCKLPMK